jgi:hypothetical protein
MSLTPQLYEFNRNCKRIENVHVPLLNQYESSHKFRMVARSHFVPLECEFLLIVIVIVRITLNLIGRQMPLNAC